jgi:hypothetical protein
MRPLRRCTRLRGKKGALQRVRRRVRGARCAGAASACAGTTHPASMQQPAPRSTAAAVRSHTHLLSYDAASREEGRLQPRACSEKREVGAQAQRGNPARVNDRITSHGVRAGEGSNRCKNAMQSRQ